MACIYYDTKKNKQYNSIQDLIKDFYKDFKKFQLKNTAIFSAEEIQKSTVDKILAIKEINAYKKSEGEEVLDFITKEHPGLFNQYSLLAGQERLAPEFIQINRIHKYILNKIGSLGVIDISGLTYNQKTLDELKAMGGLESAEENKLIYLLNEVEQIIEHEEQTKKFGTFIHQLISLKLLGKDQEYNNLFSGFFRDKENNYIFGSYSEKEWKSRLNSIVNEVVDKVLKFGTPITEIFLTTDVINIKGKIDLIAVDTSGDAHIFEIKISKTDYKNWDSAKQLTLDWQLAMYRQLLGQHINVDATRLYAIPIYMPTLGNPNTVYLEDFANRISESKSGLGPVGRITERANQLLPRKVVVAYDPDREKRILNKLHTLLDNYKIETGIEDYDVDKIIENAKKRYEKEKIWRKWNQFKDIEGLDSGYMEAQTEAEFREKIEKYVAHAKLQMNRNVSILKDAMISAIKTGQDIKTSSYSNKKDMIANHLLKEYLNDEWDVINDIPEALPMGLIVLKSKRNGRVNIISLSINNFKASSPYGNRDYGDLEFIKAFLFVNEFKKELFPSSTDKLGEIIVYNPVTGQSDYGNVVTKFKDFKNIMYERGLQDSLKITENDLLGIENIAMYNLDVSLRSYRGADKEKVNKLFSIFNDQNLEQIDLSKLLDIQKAFFEEFPEYKEKTLSTELNFNDDKELLLAMLQTAIISKNQTELSADFQNMSKFSLQFSDFKSLIAALYSRDQAEYDKAGRRIQGIVQGLAWTTPDWVRSNDLRNINKIMSTGNQHIGERMLKASESIFNFTDKYYDAINFSKAERNWVGETQSKHKNLWLQSNGTVANIFKTKNPYIDDLENRLDSNERAYLKNMLLIINGWKLEIPSKELEKLNADSLESLQKNDKIKTAIEDGSYFEMPLVRREELTRYGEAFTTPGKLWQDKIKPYMHEINDYIDPRELLKGDLENIHLQQMGFYEMYDIYGKQTPDYKAKVLEKNGVSYFEWNLDTIAHRIAFNKIRKQVFDRRLPILNAYIWWIKLIGSKQNIDLSKQLEYVTNQVNLSVYDEPIIDDEFKDLTTLTSILKKASTVGMLAFRPVFLAKEMTIGVIKGVSLAATQIYGEDQFSAADLTKAYEKLLTIDHKFSSEFNLIDKMNAFYRFANMDVNTLAKKLQSDRRGIFRGLSRWMYAANTIPDYYNRLSLFLAKMIHDGSYEAHTNEGGVFKYDPTKDKRFSYYLENRENNKDAQERYIPKKGDEKYNKQRQHYLLLMEQLNMEYKGELTAPMTEGDLITKAYSEKERSSFKSFTDMAYGYYDKDAQSQANNTWWGTAMLQFMQFWPGKMKMWFAKPITEEDIRKDPSSSPMGRFEQEFVMKGDKKVLLWRKPVLDENGEYVFENNQLKIEPTEENTGDPLLKWTGTPYEGLAYSLFYTLQDIVRMDFTAIKNNTARRNRTMYALSDAVLMFIVLGILRAMLGAIIAEKGTEGISGELLQFVASAEKKVYNEYNIFNNTLGAIKSEPVFLSWGRKTGGDMLDVLTGDKNITEFLSRNVGAAEFMKDWGDSDFLKSFNSNYRGK